MRIGVFFDRDGVLNVNTHYPHLPEDCYLNPGAVEAIARVQADDRFIPIVVTNQAGVGLGYYTREDCFRFEAELQRQLGSTIPRDQWYHSWSFLDSSPFRKPNPSMLLRAAQDHDIDLGRSAMFGDKTSDMMAGISAGCCAVYLVGKGKPALDQQVRAFMEVSCPTSTNAQDLSSLSLERTRTGEKPRPKSLGKARVLP